MLIARIGNHVEIGADSCIDRGSWRDTVIGDHSKIDNLVQIGHNVIIGKNGMFCGQTGIAGDYVTLGGRVAVRDHVSIASKRVMYIEILLVSECLCFERILSLYHPGLANLILRAAV
ncbi:hypothetical protein Q3G72_008728 [Acer saccharum]|nr:hypothetical protein Q3G72_008728 [Acer saccharum]